MKKSSYEDKQENIPALKTPEIEKWEFMYPNSATDLRIEVPEFTCVCPKTGLPDFATLIIEYRPTKFCIELKSFKEYLLFYRNLGIFHEHVVNKVLRDCVSAVKPKYMKVTGVFNSRGGIQTTVVSVYE
ncbi:NADPH-dependent 7-cyano-7-deazaguanine reductase [Fibrobacterales bacterium]|nr:NADPH-dependent 7-cyano-7-deazaguanine reductase [Fibrobacterales bacterium]